MVHRGSNSKLNPAWSRVEARLSTVLSKTQTCISYVPCALVEESVDSVVVHEPESGLAQAPNAQPPDPYHPSHPPYPAIHTYHVHPHTP